MVCIGLIIFQQTRIHDMCLVGR